MTHLLPSATPSASPPPRGEGLGVGGRPNHRRIPCAPFLALALLTSPTQAQIIPTGTPAADILLSQSLTEHRTFLTCSALDPQTYAQILQNWQRDVTAAAALLASANVPPEAITAFTTAARPENLLPAPGTPFEDVKQLCDSQPDWATRYGQLRLTILELKLPQALQ